MKDWRGRVALVTGASAGIGRAVAAELLRRGMKVATCARRLEALQELPADEHLPIQTDLRDPAQIAAMFDRVRAEWGGVDVLVNNAGLGHDAPWLTGDTEQWREILDVNVLAVAVCTREAVADMRGRGDRGHVLHISSMSAHRVPRGSAMYSASKFAVRAMTEGLRAELRDVGSGIRVTAISPGFVETEFAAHYHQSEEAARATYDRYPVLQADDITAAVIYALEQPPRAQIHDILLRPTAQPD